MGVQFVSMRKTLLLALTAVLLAGCSQPPAPAPSASPSPSAASPSPSAEPSPEGRRRGGLSIERLKEQLVLTEEQVAKIQPLLDKQREAGRERAQKFRQAMVATLTPEQKEKLKALDAQVRETGERRQPPWEQLDLSGEQAVKLEEMRQQLREDSLKARLALLEEIGAQLQPEQKARLEQMKQRMEERRREREED